MVEEKNWAKAIPSLRRTVLERFATSSNSLAYYLKFIFMYVILSNIVSMRHFAFKTWPCTIF
jgi:hypothetical protein